MAGRAARPHGIDGERLALEPGQTVVAHGIDRNLSADEAGSITPAAA
jgi:hypothetical protein